jgi:hypothetical protein
MPPVQDPSFFGGFEENNNPVIVSRIPATKRNPSQQRKILPWNAAEEQIQLNPA